jgi:hypothetical protein
MSEFFNVTTYSEILLDDGQISRATTWSSEQIYEAIVNYASGSGGGGALQYKELNDVITLGAGQTIQKDYDLGDKSIIITTAYLDIVDGSIFEFKIVDKIVGGFTLYDTGRVSHYTDSLFIPYKDKDSNDSTVNKLHTEITNHNLNAGVTLNIKILGLELKL